MEYENRNRDFQVLKIDVLAAKLNQNQVSALRENNKKFVRNIVFGNLLIQQVSVCQMIATLNISN